MKNKKRMYLTLDLDTNTLRGYWKLTDIPVPEGVKREVFEVEIVGKVFAETSTRYTHIGI